MAIGDIVSTLLGSNTATAPQQPLPTLTPESVRRRRLMAEKLMAQGMDGSPISSPWQGVARMANTALGAWDTYEADRAERQGLARATADVDRARGVAGVLAGEGAPAAPMATGAPQPPSGAAPGGNLPADRIKMAGEYFGAQGYAPHQVAGIVGNLMAESGLNTSALNPGDGRDGSDSVGIAQWNGPRARAFQQFAASRNADPKDYKTQLAFVQHELQTTERPVLAALRSATNPAEAAAAFTGYERPAGWSRNNPSGSRNFDKRVGYANRAAGLLGMGAGEPPQAAPVQVASADPSFMPQMPPQAAPQPQQGPAMPQGAPQAMPDPTADNGAPTRPAELQRLAQAASSPQVMQSAQQTAQTPQGQALVKTAQGAPLATIMDALANPWLSEGQRSVLMILAKEKIDQADPMKQLQMTKLRQELSGGTPDEQAARKLDLESKRLGIKKTEQDLAGGSATQQEAARLELETKRKALNMPNGEVLKDGEGNPIGFFDKQSMQFKPLAGLPDPQNKKTNEQRDYETAKSQGFPGTFMDYQTTIAREKAQKQYPAPSPGYRFSYDAKGNVLGQELIPGSKEAKADEQRQQATKDTASTVLDAVDRIEKKMDNTVFPTTGGMGNLLSSVPGTAAHDVRNLVETVKANTSIQKLNEMRQQSPTGGALGAVTEGEHRLLAASMASLEQSQSAEQFKQNLARVKEVYGKIVNGRDWKPGTSGPKAGDVEAGYRFKGGDAGKADNWEKVN